MHFSKLNPQGNMCAIRLYQSSGESKSGLVTVHNSNTSNGKVLGTIVEAGPESKYKDMIGRVAFFRRYAMDELKYITEKGEQTVHLISDDEILSLPQ